MKRWLTGGLLENCLFRWAAYPFWAGYSYVSSLDLNLHKHAKPHAHRQAVDIVHGPFKGWQKSHCRAQPQSLGEQLNCKQLRDFNPQTRGWGICVHSGFIFPHATRKRKMHKTVQSYCTTSTYLHFPEKAISMATWKHNSTNKSIGKVPQKPSTGCSKRADVAVERAGIFTTVTAARI